jgi:hypothetical protein
MWSDVTEAAATLWFPSRPDGLSAPPPRWGRFLIFDHLASTVEQRVWNGKSLGPHHFASRLSVRAGTETDLVGWFSGTSY